MIDPLQFSFPQPTPYDFSSLAKLGQSYQKPAMNDLMPDTTPADQQPVASRASYNPNSRGVATSIASELKAQGYSDNAIAGILYNVGQESGFNPASRSADQPKFTGEAHYAHGLYQEGGDEWNTFAADPRRAANWQDPVEQTRYLAGRLKGDIGNKQYSEVNRALNAAKTPEEAAKIFARGYLKPADRYLNARIADINRGIPNVGFYTGQE